MTLLLPTWLPPPVIECVAGHFPKGDESAARRSGDYWSDRAEQCRAYAEHHDSLAIRAATMAKGETGRAIARRNQDLAAKFRAQADYNDTLAEQLYESANGIELQKWTVYGFAAIMAAQLARAAIMFSPVGAAIEAHIDRMATLTACQIATRRFMIFLAGQAAKYATQRGTLALAGKAAFWGSAQVGGINVAVQAGQIIAGDRSELDKASAGIATAAGLFGGAAGAVAGKWIGERWIIPSTIARAEHAGGNAARVGHQLIGTGLVGASGGLVGGIAGAGTSIQLSGEEFTLDAFTEVLMPAMVGGFLGAAAHGAAEIRHATAPPAAVAAVSPAAPAPTAGPRRLTSTLIDVLAEHGIIAPDRSPGDSLATSPRQQLERILARLRQPTDEVASTFPRGENNITIWKPKDPHTAHPNSVNQARADSIRHPAGEPAVPNKAPRLQSVYPPLNGDRGATPEPAPATPEPQSGPAVAPDAPPGDRTADAVGITEPSPIRQAAEEVLRDYAARSGPDIPDEQRLVSAPAETLARMLGGDPADAACALIEVIRRGEDKVLRWTQVAAMLAMRDGPVNMDAGEGKSLVFLAHAARDAVEHGAVQVITTRDNLANREFARYEAVLGPMGIDVVRMNPDAAPPPAVPGKPTIYIGTQQDVGFAALRENWVPGRRAAIDEIDEALVHADTQYILSDGTGRLAEPEIAAQVTAARDFLAEYLDRGILTDADFGRATDQRGGPAHLTDTGRQTLERQLGRPLTDEELSRLDMAAAAKWEYAENVHYVVHEIAAQERVFIIDQTTHKVMFDPETSTESRWNGGLAQAIEAKHGLAVRNDPNSSKSITAQRLFARENYDVVTGASGTAEGSARHFTRFGMGDVVKIDRFTESRLEVMVDTISKDEAAKLRQLADDIAEMRETGRPQLILCDRNDIVASLSEVVAVDHVAVDAKWFLEQGVRAEENLQRLFDAAGDTGKVLIINMQGARGVDIPITEAARELGGLHVAVTGRSALSRDIDIQAENRAARNGDPGSVRYYTSPGDGLYAPTSNPAVRQVVIKYVGEYTEAVAAHETAPSARTHARLERAEDALRTLVDPLQEAATARHQQARSMLDQHAHPPAHAPPIVPAEDDERTTHPPPPDPAHPRPTDATTPESGHSEPDFTSESERMIEAGDTRRSDDATRETALQRFPRATIVQVLDTIEAELRGMDPVRRRHVAALPGLAELPAWFERRLAHDVEAQRLAAGLPSTMSPGAWHRIANDMTDELATIVGLNQPGIAWTDPSSSDPLRELREISRHADAPAGLKRLVEDATQTLGLADIAAAVQPLHTSLAGWPNTEHRDAAVDIAWELALWSRNQGFGSQHISGSIVGQQPGNRWVRIEVTDDSRERPRRPGIGDNDSSRRAFHMLERLAGDWGVGTAPGGGTRIWFEIGKNAPADAEGVSRTVPPASPDRTPPDPSYATIDELHSWAATLSVPGAQRFLTDTTTELTSMLDAFQRGESPPVRTAVGAGRLLTAVLWEQLRRFEKRTHSGPISDYPTLFAVARDLAGRLPQARELSAAANVLFDLCGAFPFGAQLVPELPGPQNELNFLDSLPSHIRHMVELMEQAVESIPWADEASFPERVRPEPDHRDFVESATGKSHGLGRHLDGLRTESTDWADFVDKYLTSRSVDGFDAEVNRAFRSSRSGSAPPSLRALAEAAEYLLTRSARTDLAFEFVRTMDQAFAEAVTRAPDQSNAAARTVRDLSTAVAERTAMWPAYGHPLVLRNLAFEHLGHGLPFHDAFEKAVHALDRGSARPETVGGPLPAPRDELDLGPVAAVGDTAVERGRSDPVDTPAATVVDAADIPTPADHESVSRALEKLAPDATVARLNDPDPGNTLRLESWWEFVLSPQERMALIKTHPAEVLAMDVRHDPETLAAANHQHVKLLVHSLNSRPSHEHTDSERQRLRYAIRLLEGLAVAGQRADAMPYPHRVQLVSFDPDTLVSRVGLEEPATADTSGRFWQLRVGPDDTSWPELLFEPGPSDDAPAVIPGRRQTLPQFELSVGPRGVGGDRLGDEQSLLAGMQAGSALVDWLREAREWVSAEQIAHAESALVELVRRSLASSTGEVLVAARTLGTTYGRRTLRLEVVDNLPGTTAPPDIPGARRSARSGVTALAHATGTWLEFEESIIEGLLPPGATGAEILDQRLIRHLGQDHAELRCVGDALERAGFPRQSRRLRDGEYDLGYQPPPGALLDSTVHYAPREFPLTAAYTAAVAAPKSDYETISLGVYEHRQFGVPHFNSAIFVAEHYARGLDPDELAWVLDRSEYVTGDEPGMRALSHDGVNLISLLRAAKRSVNEAVFRHFGYSAFPLHDYNVHIDLETGDFVAHLSPDLVRVFELPATFRGRVTARDGVSVAVAWIPRITDSAVRTPTDPVRATRESERPLSSIARSISGGVADLVEQASRGVAGLTADIANPGQEREANTAARPRIENSPVFHELMARIGNPLIARNLAARVHERAAREQLSPRTDAQLLSEITETVLAEHRTAMAQLGEAIDHRATPRKQARRTPFQHAGLFFHNTPDDQSPTPDNPAENQPSASQQPADSDSLLHRVRTDPDIGVRLGAELLNTAGFELMQTVTTLYFLEHAGPAVAGAVGVATHAPYLAVALIAGHLTDHTQPKKLLMGSQIVAIAAGTAATAALVSGTPHVIPILVGTTLVGSTASVIYSNAAGKALIEMAGKAQSGLTRFENLKVQLTRALGSGFGPMALQAGAWVAPLLDVGTSIANLATLRRLPTFPTAPKRDESQGAWTHLRESIGEGFHAMRDLPLRRRFLSNLVMGNIYLGMQSLQFTSLISDSGLPGWQQGAALLITPLGGLVGNLIPTRWLEKTSVDTLLTARLAGIAGTALFAATTTNPWLEAAGFAGTWAILSTASMPIRTYMNRTTPSEVRGRVASIGLIATRGSLALGPALAGGAIALLGQHTTGTVMAATFATIAGWSLYHRLHKARKLLDSINQTAKATWALGLDTGTTPRKWHRSPEHLRRAIATQLVKIEFDPDTEDPIAKTIEGVRNLEDRADTAVLLLDDGANMHSLTITNTDNKPGGAIVVFDTEITNPEDPHTDPNDPERIPRVRALDDWKQSYPDIKEAFVALLTTDENDNLTARHPHDPKQPTPRKNGKVRGLPPNQE